jgi:hypothetical protein
VEQAKGVDARCLMLDAEQVTTRTRRRSPATMASIQARSSLAAASEDPVERGVVNLRGPRRLLETSGTTGVSPNSVQVLGGRLSIGLPTRFIGVTHFRTGCCAGGL